LLPPLAKQLCWGQEGNPQTHTVKRWAKKATHKHTLKKKT